MQAIVASTVKHTTTSTSFAAISTRPARAAATAARSALTAKDRSRSPSSSLSPVPPSPQDNVYDPAAEALGSPRDVAGISKGEQVKVEDDEVEEPKPKKKRTRKPKEPVVYDIPPVEQLTTTFNRTCRLDTIAKEDKGVPYLKELTRQNIKDLKTLIEWNAAHNIFFMRMSSDIAPFASHPDLQYSLDYVSEELKEAGDTANRLGVVVENAYRDLEYHNEVMDRMGLGKDSVMIIHGGGVFGDKEATLKRFRENYKELSQGVKNRLVLENDEICYNCDDLLPVCEELNIPLVFDYHHDWIYPSKQPPSELIPRILKLWERKGIKPKFHLSEPRKGAETIMEKRAHADRCQRLPEVLPDDMDLMIEAKDKEQAVFHLYRIYNLHPVIHEDLRPPALEETKQTAGRKSHKPKKGKKGATTDEDGTDGTAGTATDGTAGEGDEEQTGQVVHALVDGEMPLPEGKDAEGQAYDSPLTEKKKRTPRKKAAERVKEEDGAAADGATSPAKKRGGAGTKRKSKAAEEMVHLDGKGVEADEVEPPAAKKARTPKKASLKGTTEDATA
ncbi:hypothetical protein Rhopal_000021-T1 [Rhodotorula paludigena]|uniref:UV-endonuclease UvdE n=1 Tax=Rhodotorula paludigena TaxID=86838 RepID=A0AAV5G3Y7_9BASI|nr:hypothetical protein Rhopal_000021-T1 [Rhodotorula paludigena]